MAETSEVTEVVVTSPLTRHLERWQGNWIRREPQATENPVTRFPLGGKHRNAYDHKKRM